LTGGRRTALPRHQTLRATLDWSYSLLTETECILLQRLSIFAGPFALTEAEAIVLGTDSGPPPVGDARFGLVAKSLVSAQTDTAPARYRLLETTRAYAFIKLRETGEFRTVARRHAEYYCDLFERAAAGLEAPPAGLAAEYWRAIDELRAALLWAFSHSGDQSVGVALVVASAEIFFALALWMECEIWTGRALEIIDVRDRGTRREMVLQLGFGSSSMFTKGVNEPALAALARAAEIAENLEDSDYLIRSLAALTSACHRREQFQEALDLGRRAEAFACKTGDAVALSVAHWMLGTSLHYLGEYREALHYAELTRRFTRTPAIRRAHIVKFGRDDFIAGGCTMAILLWVQGFADQSAALAREVLADAAESDHPFSLCTALAWSGCIIALLTGDFAAAMQSIAHLKRQSEMHGLTAYNAYSEGFEGQLLAARGEYAAAEWLLGSCLSRLSRIQNDNFYGFRITLSEVLANSGRVSEGLAAAEAVVRRIERSRQLWWLPEALRITGETLLLLQQVEAAEDQFRRALDCARRQGALSWELRVATSVARLLRTRGHSADAMAILKPVYDRFTEGFETADLVTARTLLAEQDS
jgi:predicted ATPase